MKQDGIKRASIDKLKSRFETAYYSEDMVITPLVMFRELDDLTALIQGVSIGVTVSGTAKIKINGKLLIMLRNLSAEITASRVDNKVFSAILVHIDLDKVIATAKRTERTLKSLGILKVSVATKGGKIKSLLSAIPNISTARDKVRRLVKLLKIDIYTAKVNGVHTATDIYTNH